MACQICDNKPPNCDCTELERRQHEEIERLTAELERHRMTPEERVAAGECATDSYGVACNIVESDAHSVTLRNYLDRTAPKEEGNG